MASFTREDYLLVYTFALDRWIDARGGGETFAASNASRVMDLCEDVIGRQANRPPLSRLRNFDEREGRLPGRFAGSTRKPKE